ncbi:hypothetical protein Ddye_030569 [Dipteronia dyeriana]|uniref:Transmembrane protein n=1 Tax=Dipteronia dyeriana TaxID=168575 RepID=A0AAD9WMN1_9ROSI|nr:hypothetical protein Ddye_030568 [Dipteronia dyeriana]KAK2635777.1 hypothetical protein Ddye_030569 [Dipteronia dyeriana]
MAVSSKLLLLVMITLIFIPVPSSQFQNHNHTKLEPVHIDQIPSSTKFHNHSHRFLVRMQRDVKRVAALTHLLSPAKSYEVLQTGRPCFQSCHFSFLHRCSLWVLRL